MRGAWILPVKVVNHHLEAGTATKFRGVSGQLGSRLLSNEGIYYADKHALLSINNHVKSLDDIGTRARLRVLEVLQLFSHSHMSNLAKKRLSGSFDAITVPGVEIARFPHAN